MDRREFLRLAGLGLAQAAFPWPGLAAGDTADPLAGLSVVDIHAHPRWGDGLARIADMRPAGLSAAAFAVVGDREWSRSKGATPFAAEYPPTLQRFRELRRDIEAEGRLAVVLRAADVPQPGAEKPGAILALEGGDPLEGQAARVDEYHALGVRLITLIHDRHNHLGDTMRPNKNGVYSGEPRGGLSDAGRVVVARMEALGMLVDVAHASAATLADILAVAKNPVVDSHTAPCRRADQTACGRWRTWPEMESVAEQGGVVCCWAWGRPDVEDGFAAWARSVMDMKARLGPAAIGLGTDTGGHLQYARGYDGWLGLRRLAAALLEAGMKREELAAFCGGNVLRLLGKCLG